MDIKPQVRHNVFLDKKSLATQNVCSLTVIRSKSGVPITTLIHLEERVFLWFRGGDRPRGGWES